MFDLEGGGGRGIPFPAEREGLPCEDKLLNAASPRSPSRNISENELSVNRQENTNNPVLCFLEEITALKERYPIDENAVIGIDIGLSSCGIAHISNQEIAFLGVRLFESGEIARTQQTRAGDRRNKRTQRIRMRRHARRRSALRQLLAAHGMWPGACMQASTDIYNLRVLSLDRLLEPQEFGACLFHAVKRRGFVARSGPFSSSAGDPASLAEQTARPMAAAAAVNGARAAAYRTAGEMLARDPLFAHRKRNRFGNYQSALPRRLVEEEVAAMFAAQRRLGSPCASLELQAAFEAIAFFQLPRRHSAAMRACPYLPDERIGVQRAPTIERFTFFDRLTKLRLEEAGEVRRLRPEELQHAARRFGRTAGITFLDLRRWLALGPAVRFVGIRQEDADIVSPAGSAFGTVTLRSILGRRRWTEVEGQDGMPDALAAAVTLAATASDLRGRLAGLAAPEEIIAPLLAAFANGELDAFAGMARLSAAAAARMLPHLEQGHLVFDAAVKAGFDPLRREDRLLHTIVTPRVIRPVLEAMKQVHALIQETGAIPGRIHVEVAQDLGLTPAQRTIAQGRYRKLAEARQAAWATLSEIVPPAAVTSRMVERYMLWQEQGGRCVYSGQPISIEAVLEGEAVQIDHVQPLSRSADHSQQNRVICYAHANQQKGNRTPFEWFGGDGAAWAAFAGRVAAMPLDARKRKILLSREFARHEGRVLVRNLNDTGYVARCVTSALRALYRRSEGYRRVITRPGQMTAVLRRAWGFSKDRADVRSHALDALMVAVADDRTLHALAKGRRSGAGTFAVGIPLPWPGFRMAVLSALSETRITRSERRRGRGPAHLETVRRARRDPDGSTILYERRPLHRLRRQDLDRIPDPAVNAPLIKALSEWLAAGGPVHAPPLSPQGDPIRRVRLRLTGATRVSRDGILVRGGVAGFGRFIRLDLYVRDGQFALVPIHAADVGTRAAPPVLAARARKLRDDWLEVGPEHRFLFSIFRHSLLRVSYRDGRTVEGFFRSFDQNSMRLVLADIICQTALVHAPVGRAVSIQKFAVDRLGRRTEVKGEVRTWRGRNAPWPVHGPAAGGAAKNNASMVEA